MNIGTIKIPVALTVELEPTSSETGWVVECDSPVGLLYWSGHQWSTNNLDAVRFARAVDAERVATIYRHTPAVRVGEHMWYSPKEKS